MGRSPGKPKVLSTVDEVQQSRIDEHRKKEAARLREYRRQNKPVKKSDLDHLAHDFIEDKMIAMIDYKDEVEKLAPLLTKLQDDKLDPQSFLEASMKYALKQLVSIGLTGEKEKNRLDAVKHWLGVAGMSPTQKHEVSRGVDVNTEKEAMASIIRGAAKDLKKHGIEIIDDTADED